MLGRAGAHLGLPLPRMPAPDRKRVRRPGAVRRGRRRARGPADDVDADRGQRERGDVLVLSYVRRDDRVAPRGPPRLRGGPARRVRRSELSGAGDLDLRGARARVGARRVPRNRAPPVARIRLPAGARRLRSRAMLLSRLSGSMLRPLFVLGLALAAPLALGSCVTVHPYERELLARPAMDLSSEAAESSFRAHVHDSREGATG